MLLFCDVGGRHESPHAAEDEDCYRFIDDAAAKNVGGQLVVLNEAGPSGRSFGITGCWATRASPSAVTSSSKSQPASGSKQNCQPEDTMIYVASTGPRCTVSRPSNATTNRGWRSHPLTEPPYLDKEDMLKWCADEGLVPRACTNRTPANCGGGCVRAGQGQFAALRNPPERFAYWESQMSRNCATT